MSSATITDTATHRYGYAPQVMFAATRAGAERRARDTAAAAALDLSGSRSARSVIRGLASRLAKSSRG